MPASTLERQPQPFASMSPLPQLRVPWTISTWALRASAIIALVLGAWMAIPPDRAAPVPNAGQPQSISSTSAIKPCVRPIVEYRVGFAVLTDELRGGHDTALGDKVVPESWRHLILKARKRDRSFADVELLRPLSWLEEHRARIGGRVEISVPECGIEGEAHVLDIRLCPLLQPTPPGYRTVTGTFRHQSAHVFDLFVDGEDEPIGTTANHPFWSEDRHEFVRADTLRPGEHLLANNMPVAVSSIVPRAGPEPVFNLEVFGDHTYHVGSSPILVHNGILKVLFGECPNVASPKGNGGSVVHPQGNLPNAKKWIDNGGHYIQHADGTMTYIKDNIKVTYSTKGYPDFTPHLYDGTEGLKEVRIDLTGSRHLDEKAANAKAGFKNGTPDNYIWHHNEDTGLMQLVHQDVHEMFYHSGGFSLF